MECEFCDFYETWVVETRETKEDVTRRRRECQKCKKRFTTYERIELYPLIVIKKTGMRESFDRQKIKSGLIRSSEKRQMPIEKINKVADEKESE